MSACLALIPLSSAFLFGDRGQNGLQSSSLRSNSLEETPDQSRKRMVAAASRLIHGQKTRQAEVESQTHGQDRMHASSLAWGSLPRGKMKHTGWRSTGQAIAAPRDSSIIAGRNAPQMEVSHEDWQATAPPHLLRRLNAHLQELSLVSRSNFPLM